LYRPDVVRLNYDEGTIFERFKALASPLVRREPISDWEWYFLAQHHGLSTRLLDWTENLLAAIHFALCQATSNWSQTDLADEISRPPAPAIFDDQSPVVWMIDAGTLNVTTCGADKDYVFLPSGERAQAYLPSRIESPSSDNELPIALLAPRSNERIVAQQGLFTIHGHANKSIDELTAPEFRIARLVFDRANLGRVWHDLQTCGVHWLSLFPDLDRVAQHVMWACQNDSRTAGARM
jgi:hypothetical protein